MIHISECELTAPQINGQRFLVFRVRAKPEDYDQETMDAVYDAVANGTPMECFFKPFQTEAAEDPLPKKRSRLAYLMQRWCEQESIREEDEVSRIYAKYCVTSRTDLTELQLDKEIDSYNAGLLLNN